MFIEPYRKNALSSFRSLISVDLHCAPKGAESSQVSAFYKHYGPNGALRRCLNGTGSSINPHDPNLTFPQPSE
jgi:hypothetical protein